jgi:3-oxoacyl-[acyl-carrier protein] reductase
MKTMIITGGSRGIGAGRVRYFRHRGWQVVFCWNNAEKAAASLAEETGATAIRCDVRDEKQVKQMFSQALRLLGHLDALICNAGAAWSGLLEEMPLDEYERLTETNLRGTYLCTRSALPYLRDSRGSIVMVSSRWGLVGASCEAVYSATKAGIQCMARSLAKEVGPSGVRVNCIAPGAVDTDMMAAYSKDDKKELADQTPLGRLCTEEDVAQAAEFLLNAEFVTGQTLAVDGGFTL